MPGYGQFCPVAQALEIVGERWTLLIIRELLCGNYRFGELMCGVPQISRSLLAQRLRSLEEAGLVERQERSSGNGHEYRLTPAGRELEPVVMGLGMWGRRWLEQQYAADELDPVLLMWDVHRRLHVDRLPAEPTTVHFWFHDLPAKRSRYWLHVQRPDVDVCFTNPGFEVQLTVEAKLRSFVEVWMGARSWNEAEQSGAIRLVGPAPLRRAFPSWLALSAFARPAPAAAATAP